MNSIRVLYKKGCGPSSSHSMGPKRAAALFKEALPENTVKIVVELLGSLALTGKGHLTDRAVLEGLDFPNTEIKWRGETFLPHHPNALIFHACDKNGKELVPPKTFYSVGGGDLEDESENFLPSVIKSGYPHDSITEVTEFCRKYNLTYYEYVAHFENDASGLEAFLNDVWQTMKGCVEEGLKRDDPLPGDLKLARRAQKLKNKADDRIGIVRDMNLVSAYAQAASEQNASGANIITAPTCGSCGILPGVLYYFHRHYNIPEENILRAIMTAGLFGCSVVARASISGSQVGCQGEVGTAISMAAAATAQLWGGSMSQIEYAAEIGMEHTLGLTCDPVFGLVQVPCIERNALGAVRALSAASYSLATDGMHLVRFDDVIDVMYATGIDMQAKYRETAQGGLAKIMRERFNNR